MAAVGGPEGGGGEFEGLRPIAIPEMAEAAEKEAEENEAAAEVPAAVLAQVKVKVKKLEKFDELWRSSGIAVKHKASIWGDRLGASTKLIGGRNR